MANTSYPQDLIQKQKLARLKSESQELSKKLLDFSILVQEKVDISDFKGARKEKNLKILKKSIYKKIDFSSKLLNDSRRDLLEFQHHKDISFNYISRDLLEVQHYKDISFLYLWSTLNDIIKLRTKKNKENNWLILKYDEGKAIIKEHEAKSTINDYLNIDYKKLLLNREAKSPINNDPFIEKSWILDLEKRLKKILKTLLDLNREKSERKIFIQDNDLIVMVLLYEDPTYLYKFGSCKSIRNKLLMIHGDVLKKPVFVRKDHIENMKDLIELLLYLK